ncbi:MAG: hypothetical protein NXI24_15150 [bacterium]|nr:hypothetical protein [bacterium]
MKLWKVLTWMAISLCLTGLLLVIGAHLALFSETRFKSNDLFWIPLSSGFLCFLLAVPFFYFGLLFRLSEPVKIPIQEFFRNVYSKSSNANEILLRACPDHETASRIQANLRYGKTRLRRIKTGYPCLFSVTGRKADVVCFVDDQGEVFREYFTVIVSHPALFAPERSLRILAHRTGKVR